MFSGRTPQLPARARNSLVVFLLAFLDNFEFTQLVKKDPLPMKTTNQTPPERMSAEQRRSEIASILALGIVRLRQSNPTDSQIKSTRSRVLLAFSGDQSVHTDHPNN
jgi:hypothetical protein